MHITAPNKTTNQVTIYASTRGVNFDFCTSSKKLIFKGCLTTPFVSDWISPPLSPHIRSGWNLWQLGQPPLGDHLLETPLPESQTGNYSGCSDQMHWLPQNRYEMLGFLLVISSLQIEKELILRMKTWSCFVLFYFKSIRVTSLAEIQLLWNC